MEMETPTMQLQIIHLTARKLIFLVERAAGERTDTGASFLGSAAGTKFKGQNRA
jgi:hypothetical protein